MTTPASSIRVPSILCVDDEQGVLNALQRLLRRESYVVLTATSGVAALDIMHAKPVNVVISDMRMPGMEGSELLATIRVRWPRCVRLLLTGQADMPSTIAAINEGWVARYIAKPWDDAEVIGIVREVLEHQRIDDERRELQVLAEQQNAQLRDVNATLEQRVEERTFALNAALHDLERANKRLRAQFVMLLQIFSNVIDMRSADIAGHSQRVANLAFRVAGKLQVSTGDAQDVMMAGLLHDIGKVGWPDSLGAKSPASLTPDERAMVTRHPLDGSNLIARIEQLRGAAALVRAHHECFDGSGYPAGLSGLAIPLGARILSTVNEYDALGDPDQAARPLSELEARRKIVRDRGTRHDPIVVDALMDLLRADAVVSGNAVPELLVTASRLKAGMRLARPLEGRNGLMLLARGYVLDADIIEQIRYTERVEGNALVISVVADSV